MLSDLAELRGSQELLRNFISRDLRVRYKGSALGIVWSLLNPLLMMVIYTVVFSIVMRAGIEHFPVFFLAGFLPWTFFSTALLMGSASLIAHAQLIQKVYFPREVLPLSMTVANLVNFGIGMALFLPFAAIVRGVDLAGLLLLVPLTAVLFLFAAGVTILFAALVVYFRDVEFLLGIATTAWFFLTPIVYRIEDAPERYQPLFRLNPMTPFVESYRSVLYYAQLPSAGALLACVVIAAGSAATGYAVFGRLEGRLAEEL
jgi:ABC-2 type transport system permease protein